jgi:hypothetical protein
MRKPTDLTRLLIGLLGVMLVIFMTVEVAHSHSTRIGSPDTSTHCSLCNTAHIALAGQLTWVTNYVLRVVDTVTLGETLPGSRPVIRLAFIRPPPPADHSLA